jgi:hypothetical protein
MSGAADVFLSYSRASARKEAGALRERLTASGVRVFLDTEAIAPGAPFPKRLAEALLGARVIVVFADEAYFGRTWCVHEYRVATAGYRAAKHEPDHVIVALPEKGVENVTAHLPPPLAEGSWPAASDTEKLAALVMERLARNPKTLGERLEGVDDDAVKTLRDGALVPAAALPHARLIAPNGMPSSLKERFAGRQEALWAIFAALESRGKEQARRSCLIQGGGGMGKSQLAAEFVARYGARHYPGGVVWIDASGDDVDLRRQLAAVESAGLKPGGEAVLWVADNVPEAAPGRPPAPIAKYCPVREHVSLLATSRRAVKGMDTTIALGELSTEAAVELLTQKPVEKKWLADDAWGEIAKWVGCWPLGLRVLNTVLGDGFLPAEAALKKARGEEPAEALDQELDALRGEIEEGALRGVAEVFRSSYASLEAQPAARRLAHLVARMARAPISEGLLAELGGEKAAGALAQRSLLEPVGIDGKRHWVMHRMVASYLRGVSTDAREEWLELMRWFAGLFDSARSWSEVAGAGRHFRVAAMGMTRWLAESGDAEAMKSARGIAAKLAVARLEEDAARGMRYTSAEWSEQLGAGDELAAKLRAIYESGDAETRRMVMHAASGLHSSAQAAELFIAGFRDAEYKVRRSARVQSSFSDRVELLAAPLLDAMLEDEHAEAYEIDFILRGPPERLRGFVSHIAHRLSDAGPRQRAMLSQALGKVLRAFGGGFEAGGWRTEHLLRQLGHMALNDPDRVVRTAAANAMGQFENAGTLEALERVLAEAADMTAWRRAAEAIVEYAKAAESPPPPDARMTEEEGRLTMEVHWTRSTPRRPELYAAVARAAVDAQDAERRAAAVEIVTRYDTGKLALSNAVLDAYEAGRLDEAQAVAEETLRQLPEFSSPSWWRGLVLESRKRYAEAAQDYTRVIELTPAFADAWARRAVMRAIAGDADGARGDIAEAKRIAPEDAHIEQTRQWVEARLG